MKERKSKDWQLISIFIVLAALTFAVVIAFRMIFVSLPSGSVRPSLQIEAGK